MSVIVVKNTAEGEEPLDPPTHPENRLWSYAMYFNGGYDVAFADTYGELLDVLIPGYADLTDDVDEATARITLGVRAAVVTQAMILSSADLTDVSDADYAVLTAPKVAPAVRADLWMCPVPLVVVESLYQPYTEVPRPASGLGDYQDAENLWWIRPGEDEEFLFSLHEVGFIRLLTSSVED